jgi:hypothetical protein
MGTSSAAAIAAGRRFCHASFLRELLKHVTQFIIDEFADSSADLNGVPIMQSKYGFRIIVARPVAGLVWRRSFYLAIKVLLA